MRPNLWWGLGLNKVCLPSQGVLLPVAGGRTPGIEKCAGLRFPSHSVRSKAEGDLEAACRILRKDGWRQMAMFDDLMAELMFFPRSTGHFLCK